MARVFTTVPGDKVWIGGHGEATSETPAIVPDAVADELEAEMKGEPADPAIPGHRGRPAYQRFRIERDDPEAPRRRAPKGKE